MKSFIFTVPLFFLIINSNCQVRITAEKNQCNEFTNLYKLNDSIYRSEQPDSLDIKLLKELGIRSILNLRRFHSDTTFMGSRDDFYFYHVKMYAFSFSNKQIAEAMSVLIEAPKPILIHCKHGSDRTGVVVAMYRILFEQWTKKEAIKELKTKDFGFHGVFVNIPCYIRKVNTEKLKSKICKQKRLPN